MISLFYKTCPKYLKTILGFQKQFYQMLVQLLSLNCAFPVGMCLKEKSNTKLLYPKLYVIKYTSTMSVFFPIDAHLNFNAIHERSFLFLFFFFIQISH